MTRYHCYIGYMDGVMDVDVEAETPDEAAIAAAGKHGVDGQWTVIAGEPVRVNVVERKTYEVKAPPAAAGSGCS